MIGVLPLALISLVSHHRASETVQGYVAGSLQQTALQYSGAIESSLVSRLALAVRQAQDPILVDFSAKLHASFESSRLAASKYVTTSAWQRLVSSRTAEIKHLSLAEGFTDAWLIDGSGNVLFTVSSNGMVGTDMLAERASPEAQAVLKALATSRQVVVQKEDNANHALRQLIVFSPIARDRGPAIGVLACVLPADFLLEIIGRAAHPGPVATVSLVGSGFSLTTGQDGTQQARASADSVIPPGHQPAAFSAEHFLSELHPYGLEWRVLAEMTEEAALGPMADLSATMLVYLGIICLAVLLLAAFCSRWLVEPIRQLSDWARGVAGGDLSERRIAPPDNEIGELCVNFRQVVRSFQEVADACAAISLGHETPVDGIRGKDDVLGRLVTQMAEMKAQVENFRQQREELKEANEELAEQAQSLITSKQKLRAEQDQLHLANEKLAARAADLLATQEKVTSQYRQLEEVKKGLELRTGELEQVSRYKSEFLANMSHELRTPLNSMLILSRILADNKEANLTSRQVEFARTIHASGANLLELISDILDLSRVEAGKISLRHADVEISEFAVAMERVFAEVAAAKQIAFSVKTDPTLPDIISTDRMRLEQIVRNFLDNAFKFTEHGEVLLAIRREEDAVAAGGGALSGPAVSFSVFDTGIGFPAAKREEIFEEFQQGDASITRRYGGSGLGLAICRKLTEMLGGEIVVTSVPGEGSSFTLLLPLVRREQKVMVDPNRSEPAEDDRMPSVAPVEYAQLTSYLADRRLLIIDQDMRTVFAVTGFFEDLGGEVVVAKNVEECLSLLGQDAAVDFVLIDFVSPEARGCRTTAAIRAIESCRALPLVALLPTEMATDGPECIRQGLASDYLAKPVDSARLAELFLRLLKTFPRH